jgi:hypothetical protein
MEKKDLLFKDEYSWRAIAQDNPLMRRNPDNKMFSRKEGYEILYLINQVAQEMRLRETRSFQALELMIKTRLPSHIRNRSNVKDWLKQNFNKYFHASRYK